NPKPETNPKPSTGDLGRNPKPDSATDSDFRFRNSLLGLGLFVFAVVALSGPGRIDIVDGQTRYEVARGLAEHGDSIIRDPRIDFSVFPGRDGAHYTYYRFPQSLLGAAAIWLGDLTGPTTEARRQFFFVLTSALACAMLAMVYAGWF